MRSGLRPSFCENTAMAKATVTELLRIGKSRRLFRECFCRAHAKSRERRRAGKMCQIVSKKDYANPKPVSFHRPIKLFFAACKTCSTMKGAAGGCYLFPWANVFFIMVIGCRYQLSPRGPSRIHLVAFCTARRNGMAPDRTKHQNSFSALFRYGVLGVALVYSWYGSKPTFGSFHILRFRGQWLSEAQRYEQSSCFPILSLWEFYPEVLQRSLLRQ
jgi:hypothetical protein